MYLRVIFRVRNVSYIFEILSKVWFCRLSFVLHMQNVVISLRIGFSSYIAAVLPRLVINVFKGVSTNVMVNDFQWVVGFHVWELILVLLRISIPFKRMYVRAQ